MIDGHLPVTYRRGSYLLAYRPYTENSVSLPSFYYAIRQVRADGARPDPAFQRLPERRHVPRHRQRRITFREIVSGHRRARRLF